MFMPAKVIFLGIKRKKRNALEGSPFLFVSWQLTKRRDQFIIPIRVYVYDINHKEGHFYGNNKSDGQYFGSDHPE